MSSKKIILIILFVAALLRIWNLAAGDITGSDEVFYAFRAIGMLDFDNSPAQPSVLELLERRPVILSGSEESPGDPSATPQDDGKKTPQDDRKNTLQDDKIPFWARLSFSDHPPLVFLVQNIFINIFGQNNFAFRLPSALLGIASVYLIYLIARKLFTEKTGLIAAALAAVTVNFVYISRAGLQEAYVIFFLLLASYFFIKAVGSPSTSSGTKNYISSEVERLQSGNSKYFLWAGVALGLGFLTKYNVFILVPIFLTYAALFRRDLFKNKKFWIGALISLIIFTPVIIYNIGLFATFGHFDFQFSYIFGQNPEVWQSAPGKEAVGTLADRISNFIPNLLATNSWVFLLTFASALLYFIHQLIKKNWVLFKQKAFISIALFWLVILLLVIGPTFRFLTMLTPFIVIEVAIFLAAIWSRLNLSQRGLNLCGVGLALILIWEVFYSANTQVINYPVGPQFWAWSRLRFENYNWGYNELDNYFKKELNGKMPALSFDTRYRFLESIQKKALDKARALDLEPYPALIIYDNNIASPAQLWIFDRLQIYSGWPVVDLETYLKIIRENGTGYFRQAGIANMYFVAPTGLIPLKSQNLGGELTDAGNIFEKELLQQGVTSLALENKQGDQAFRIYKF